MQIPALFADVDWIRLSIFIVVGVAYLISFIANRLRDRQIAKSRLPKPPRRDQETAKELEDFLKRSSANRRDEKPKPARPVSTRPVSTVPARSQESRTRAARRKPEERGKQRKAEGPTTTLVNLRESNLTKERTAEPAGPLRPSIDTHGFAERAEHLGSIHEARPLESHLKQSFAHQVGTLAPAAGESLAAQNRAAAAAAAATGSKQTLPIAALLSGGNLRNAVILHEIFQRPEERW
jgi:hypothetical protein